MIIKRILSFTICLSLLASPVMAVGQTFGEYDFSDEAQLEFNQNNDFYNPESLPQNFNPVTESSQKFKRHKEKDKTLEIIDEVNLENVSVKTFEVPKYDPRAALEGSVVYVPQGAVVDIQLQSGISSGSLDENDKLTALLPSNWIHNGNLIAPAGSLVYGTATDTTPAGYAYGSGSMELNFDKIITPDGQVYNINAEKIVLKNESLRGKKMAVDIALGAGIGLLTGLLFTALGANCYGNRHDNRDYGSAMLIYGAAGAAGGGIKGLASRGSDVQVDADTVLQLKLIEPLRVVPQNVDTKLPNH